MEERFILSKESNSEDIKRYFEAILKLSQSDDEFPVNLDEVWMLVYTEKGKAVRALKENFFEGEDFHLAQNGKVIQSSEIQNGIKVEYHLTLSCMEYFIARKVRPVFDVYRQVFHKSIEVVKQLAEPKKPKMSPLSIEDQFKMMSLACKEMKASKADKNAAMNNLLMQNGLPPITFSVQTNGKHALSARDLIQIEGLNISSEALFALMKAHGYVETRRRSTTTTKSGFSDYSVLTEKGEKWGFNEPSRYAANKYDIRLYKDKFSQLWNEIKP